MMNARMLAAASILTLLTTAGAPSRAPLVLVNHLGYDATGPKRAILQGHAGDKVGACAMADLDTGARTLTSAPSSVGSVAKWRDWVFWTVDFSSVTREGQYRLACTTGAGEVFSPPFRIQKDVLERHTLSDVLFYFKTQRSSGLLDRADRTLPVQDRPGPTVDAHGGWFDATGDYGKHLTHLSFSTYFNPQQIPMTAWGLMKTHELLAARGDVNFKQYLRRLTDEGAWGADFLVRMKAPSGSFYRSVSAPGGEKRPEDRKIGKDSQSFALTATPEKKEEWPAVVTHSDAAYQTSLRAGGGVAIAALARAAATAVPGERKDDYLGVAEAAWAFLAAHNRSFTNDGKENILDDYCALLAATELYRAAKKAEYLAAADARADSLMKRLMPAPRAYWRADDKDRPFFHAVEAGLPVVSLLEYAAVASAPRRAAARDAVRASLEWELAVTSEVANPFGYARQLVQTTTGRRETRFFFPHETEAAPWWQGENARLGSLAAAARLAIPYFEKEDAAFAERLRVYARDQLNWILGANPFDVSMLRGTGRGSPEYFFFDTYQYTPAPGGIANGITGGFKDETSIDFHQPQAVTGGDNDWRWQEQWLPHATWYMLAVAAGD